MKIIKLFINLMDISQPGTIRIKDIEKNSNYMIIEYSKDFIRTISEIVFGDKTLLLMML